MKELIKVLDVWMMCDKTLQFSADKKTYTMGVLDGRIEAFEKVKLLLEAQLPNKTAEPTKKFGDFKSGKDYYDYIRKTDKFL
jgi:hypothetical protein